MQHAIAVKIGQIRYRGLKGPREHKNNKIQVPKRIKTPKENEQRKRRTPVVRQYRVPGKPGSLPKGRTRKVEATEKQRPTMEAECGTKRLHGLAQPHFVGQERPPALAHDKLNALNLGSA